MSGGIATERILWLGPENPTLQAFLTQAGHPLTRTEDPLTPDTPALKDTDWIISYGYRHLLKPWLLDRFAGRVINLHISLLPWNRGADPNLWSFLENTPKGVTIHRVDAGLDTGDILAQAGVTMQADDTLATSYARLKAAMEILFTSQWSSIRDDNITATPQPPGGTQHKLKDKAPYEVLLTHGWHTPVSALIGKASPHPLNGSLS